MKVYNQHTNFPTRENTRVLVVNKSFLFKFPLSTITGDIVDNIIKSNITKILFGNLTFY